MSKIEKHGLPTRATVGTKGDIYIDLDTGVKYECHGTYGFVDMDSVDEPVEYKWERVDVIDQSRLPESLQFKTEIKKNVLLDEEITNDGVKLVFSKDLILEENKRYHVVYDGVDYLSDTAFYEDTDKNSCIVWDDEHNEVITVCEKYAWIPKGPTMKHTLMVYEEVEVTTKIDQKYLPESHQFGSEVKQNVLLDEEFTFNEGWADFSKPFYPDWGKIHKVVINGTEYVSGEPYTDDTDGESIPVYDGNGEAIGTISRDFANFNYRYISNITCSLKIYTEEEKITKIDEKYLPDNAVILKSPNGTKYNITVGNDGNLTTTKITE